FAAAVYGATDRPAGNADALVRALYGMHLGLMLVWCQDRSPETPAARAALDLARDLLALAAPLLATGEAQPVAARFDAVLRPLLGPAAPPALNEQAAALLRRLFRHRRLLPDVGECAGRPCPHCLALHLPKVRYFLRSGQPVHFILPAFPAKSPSRRK